MEKTTLPQLNARGSCEQCRFCGTKINPGDKTITLVCRLNPPHMSSQLVMNQQGQAGWQVAVMWPEVTQADWCGQFAAQGN
jgi:hypothetical protein